jgi:hypothetical protein
LYAPAGTGSCDIELENKRLRERNLEWRLISIWNGNEDTSETLEEEEEGKKKRHVRAASTLDEIKASRDFYHIAHDRQSRGPDGTSPWRDDIKDSQTIHLPSSPAGVTQASMEAKSYTAPCRG